MALVNPKQIIQVAMLNGYAIAAFNVHNLETIQAVVRGASKLHSPVMIATTPGTLRPVSYTHLTLPTTPYV
jgi:tagatose 1,6-diphosphate aldolase GatY/KbaY